MSRALLAHVLHHPPLLAARSGAGARGRALPSRLRAPRRLSCSAAESAAGATEEAPAPLARKLLYHMTHHSYLMQQEALLQYIWHVALTAPRLLFCTISCSCSC
uniref:Pco069460 n=1 Tax=Arundo donax TaxID=35708 RepID=A0A0A9FKI7_ARUDO